MIAEMKAVDSYGFEPPYVDEFKDRFGSYPLVILQKFSKLPTFEIGAGGKKKWKMVSCLVGTKFRVVGTEPGKRAPILILLEDMGGLCYSVEPKVFAANFWMGTDPAGPYHYHAEVEPASASSPSPPINPAMAEILKKRREEARILL